MGQLGRGRGRRRPGEGRLGGHRPDQAGRLPRPVLRRRRCADAAPLAAGPAGVRPGRVVGPGIELAGKTRRRGLHRAAGHPVRAPLPRIGPRGRAAATGGTRTTCSCCPAWRSCSAAPRPRPAALRADLEDRVDPEFRWRNLAHNAGLDPELIDPDEPLSEDADRAAEPHQPHRRDRAAAAPRPARPFRELADELTGLPGGLEFTGTPEQFADLIEAWLTEGASDGFTLQPTTLPGLARAVHRPRGADPASAGACTGPSTRPPPCAGTCASPGDPAGLVSL